MGSTDAKHAIYFLTQFWPVLSHPTGGKSDEYEEYH